ncbi:MAG: UDP-N-acetylmuramoyl-tripeptide--D-alanyl-D-alanine ligase [Flavobacteriaceae bacterium]|nr:UDP-N-acetylmuramoyl-tripeptide--D-alanyl-D-alanine ligase [Flavobacteriaceae bacterium]
MNADEIYPWFLQSSGVCTDTRKIEKSNLFFALKGANFNGNQYAEHAIEKGAIAAIVDEKNYENKEKNIFYVQDTLHSLQELATYHRKNLNIPIIALTGSNGKTTTKELLAKCLEKKYDVSFTQGNLNNHIGVPLTLLSIHQNHEIAVIEMGANHTNEIAALCEIARPDFGYITNFGKAHLEGFGGIEGVIQAKTELYSYLLENNKIAFVNADDAIQTEKTKSIKNVSFGFNHLADYNFKRNSQEGMAAIIYDNHQIASNLSGLYNENNLAAAVSIALYFDVGIHDIQDAILHYFPKINRSQEIIRSGQKILLDAYNANPSSMEAALHNFNELDGSKTVILGDMFELGELSAQEHHDIAKLASTLNFERIYLIGKEFMQIKLVHPCLFQFPTKEVFMEFVDDEPISTDRILIKGSRGMALEGLVEMI